MNSDHAPTAEEQLPPLDVTKAEAEKATAAAWLTHGEKSLFAKLLCRERQLLAALCENREKDARIAREFEDAKAYSDIAKWQRERAEAAEAKLRAVSDALEEILKTATQFAYNPQLDNAVARIRAIVDSVPGSPQPPR